MTLKIDLYDLFAYTIPGTFYLLSFLYIINSSGLISININQINEASGWLVFIGAVIAYAVGYMFDPMAHYLEKRLSGSSEKSRDRINNFKSKYKHITFQIESSDMPVIRSYVVKQCSELGDKIEKNGATRTMLRNLSLNFLVLFVIFSYQFLISFVMQFAIFSLFVLFLSLICMRECFKFADWFYDLTLQSLVALSSEPKDFLTPSTQKVERLKTNELLSQLLKDNGSDVV